MTSRDARFTDRAAIGIDHLRDALKHQTRLFLERHGIEKKWFLWALRVDDHVYDDLSVWGDSLSI